MLRLGMDISNAIRIMKTEGVNTKIIDIFVKKNKGIESYYI